MTIVLDNTQNNINPPQNTNAHNAMISDRVNFYLKCSVEMPVLLKRWVTYQSLYMVRADVPIFRSFWRITSFRIPHHVPWETTCTLSELNLSVDTFVYPGQRDWIVFGGQLISSAPCHSFSWSVQFGVFRRSNSSSSRELIQPTFYQP